MLTLSFSRIDSYLRCPLAYKFKYEDGIEPEEVSPALIFGSAIHGTIGHFYRRLMDGQRLSESELCSAFVEDWEVRQVVPIKFNGKKPEDFEQQGQEIVKTYINSIGDDITVPLAVEEELRAPVVNFLTGEILEGVEILGFLDRLEMNGSGEGSPVEMKTSSRAYSQFQVDTSLQMSIYSYLIAKCDGRKEIHGRFEVLVKNKVPKLQRLDTVRTVKDFDQMYRTISEVVAAINDKRFYPIRGFMCPSCDFCSECGKW